MKITNITKGAVLAEQAIMADTFLKRAKGLLGRRRLENSGALILRPCNSVHTFFMRFNIDVLFVDRNNSVIEAVSGLKPFRITGIHFNAAYVVELPEGIIKFSSTSPGDILSIG